MEAAPLIKEVVINAPVSRVWEAITNKEQMKAWYFDIPAFKPEAGTEFRFEGGKDDRCYVHICVVKEVIQNKKLSYSWRYEGQAGISYVTFELFDEVGKTRLRLTHEGLETFPVDNPDLAIENFNEGWTYLIQKSLKEYLENNK
jgi:uncharacterized protein YndB with AHSA1/START domain